MPKQAGEHVGDARARVRSADQPADRSSEMGFYFPSAPGLPTTPHTVQLVLTIVFGVVCVAVLIAVAFHSRTTRSALGIVLLAGGLAASLNEAPIDALTLCWYPRGDLIQAYDTIAPIPLW